MKVAVSLLIALFPATAFADITTVMTKYDKIPRVVMKQGSHNDCDANKQIYNNEMNKGYSQPWPGPRH